ncbi:hypothetical protein CAEBREN_05426 [Caenorhabditis brenneri]|uniref:Arrestin C-terminal-like domain-containing protein n=1 Tax=Caenorhabditis brenneri TaxID=135651 RepID=G0NW99_CAEBE|nr:hypothetical protein CAEBREN_05426 [Caenorhabditis brenneri]
MSLEIEFNNSNGKYTAGNAVSGNVVIKNDVPIEVTGLKITMFTNCKFWTGKYVQMKPQTVEWTQPEMMETLNSALFDNKDVKSKILEAGTHLVPFTFKAFSKDHSYTYEDEDIFNRYFVKAELDIKHKGSISAKKYFKLAVLSLNDYPDALEWQTQSLEKHPGSKSRRVSMEITMPTGISHQESVPIHVSISNSAKNPMLNIRCRLVRTYRLPKDSDAQDMQAVVSHSVDDFDVSHGEFTFNFEINTPKCTHNGSIISETYRIEVEAQTSETTLLQLNFPVIVGKWRDGLAREDSPFEKKDSVKEEKEELPISMAGLSLKEADEE